MLKPLDRVLNGTTMYTLLLVGLAVLVAQALALAVAGRLPFGAGSLLLSLVIIPTAALGANWLLARLFGLRASVGSTLITALILVLVAAPVENAGDALAVALLGALAAASKYVLAVRGRHIFNPAAIALVVMGLIGSGLGTWWVGTPTMLPLVAIFAFLIARKLGRTLFVGVAIVVGIAAIAVSSAAQGLFDRAVFAESLTSWPLIFFAGVMLTEPQTAPATKRWRLAYAALAAAIFGSQLHFGPLRATPEVALVAANLLAFATNGGRRARLKLAGRRELAPQTYGFTFAPDRAIPFRAGQYFEWSLAHPSADARGTRRFFTVASGPADELVELAVKVPKGRASSFKAYLDRLEPGAQLEVTGPYGDFVLPPDVAMPQLWIAGGIGITPFVSMAGDLAASKIQLDIVLVYVAASEADFIYRDTFDALSDRGLTVHYCATDTAGRFSDQSLAQLAPDASKRLAYVAGPSALVRAQRRALRHLGVPWRAIHTDDFPGL